MTTSEEEKRLDLILWSHVGKNKPFVISHVYKQLMSVRNTRLSMVKKLKFLRNRREERAA